MQDLIVENNKIARHWGNGSFEVLEMKVLHNSANGVSCRVIKVFFLGNRHRLKISGFYARFYKTRAEKGRLKIGRAISEHTSTGQRKS